MSVAVGRLRHRIRLQRPVNAADGAGQLISTWTLYRTCWADIRDRGGRETLRGDQVDALVDAVVTIRYPGDGRIPVATDRIVYDEAGTTRTLHIERVERSDGDRRNLRLYVREDV